MPTWPSEALAPSPGGSPDLQRLKWPFSTPPLNTYSTAQVLALCRASNAILFHCTYLYNCLPLPQLRAALFDHSWRESLHVWGSSLKITFKKRWPHWMSISYYLKNFFPPGRGTSRGFQQPTPLWYFWLELSRINKILCKWKLVQSHIPDFQRH